MFHQWGHPENQPADCSSCPVSQAAGGEGVGFCPSSGDIEKADIIYIAERPAQQELNWQQCTVCGQQGVGLTCHPTPQPKPTPLVGRSGKLADYLLKVAGISQSRIYKTNVLKCGHPSNRYPTGKLREQAEAHCARYLKQELETINEAWAKRGKAPVVITAGAKATQFLTSEEGIKDRRGYVYLANTDYVCNGHLPDTLPPTVISLHPAYLFRATGKSSEDEARSLIPLLIQDYQKASRIAVSQSLRRVEVQHDGFDLRYALDVLSPQISRTGRLSCDFEWDTNTGRLQVWGISIGDSCYSGPWGEHDVECLVGWLATNKGSFIAHNGLTADFPILEKAGVLNCENQLHRLRDTMVIAHLAYPDMRSGMEFWGAIVTDHAYWKDIPELGGNIFRYCGQDAYAADRLYEDASAEVEQLGMTHLIPIQQKAQLALYRAAKKGIKVDRNRLEEVAKTVDQEIAAVEADTPFAGMNWRSNPQIHGLFRDIHGKLPKDRKTKQETVDKRTLQKWSFGGDEMAKRLLLLRELDMARKMYLNPYDKLADEEGIIRPDFLLSRQGTGRVSSINPNLFQVPKRSEKLKKLIRSLFIPRYEGWVFVEVDWKQIEYQLVFHFAGIPFPKEDVHARHAKSSAVDRTTAKIVTYGTNYKGSPSEIAYQAEAQGYTVPVSVIKKVQADYLAHYPQITEWWKGVERDVAEASGLQRLPFGRIRRHEGQAKDWSKEAISTTAQGTVADMLIRIVPILYYEFPEFFLLPIHDSVLYECPPDEVSRLVSRTREVMGRQWEELGNLSVPVEVLVSKPDGNWAEMVGWAEGA